jgi:hypothetical protein
MIPEAFSQDTSFRPPSTMEGQGEESVPAHGRQRTKDVEPQNWEIVRAADVCMARPRLDAVERKILLPVLKHRPAKVFGCPPCNEMDQGGGYACACVGIVAAA